MVDLRRRDIRCHFPTGPTWQDLFWSCKKCCLDVVQHNRNCSTGHNAAKPFAGFIPPTIQVPSWLESFGSAKQSCQRIYKFLQTLDFQVRYFVTQTQEVISWLQQRLATIAEALQTTASRLTKLELLVYTIDTDLALVEEKLLSEDMSDRMPEDLPVTKRIYIYRCHGGDNSK